MRRFHWLCALALPLFAAPLLAQDGSFDSGGVRLHFVEQGAGEPVILLHGFAGDLRMWSAAIPSLAEDYRVVALDVRGHGRSGKPHEPEAYGLELVEDVVRLCEHLDLERAHVVGYSMGAMIALKLASAHPERTLSIVAGGFGWAEMRSERWKKLSADISGSLERGQGIGPLMEYLTPAGRPKPSAEELMLMNQLLLATNDVQALAAAARGFQALELEEPKLRASQVPLLAIVGEVDPLRPDVERLRGVVPDLELVVVEGGDHVTTLFAPRFLECVQEFLFAHAPIETGSAGSAGTDR